MVLTLAEAKQYLRVDEDYLLEDDLITSLIKSAVQYCEKYSGLSFEPKQLQMYSTSRYIDLPYGPVNSITSVKDGVGKDMDYVTTGVKHPRVHAYSTQGYIVTYETGYTPETLPELLKTAVKMLVATLYDNRENNVITDKGGSLVELPFDVTTLLRPYSRSGGLFL